MTDHKAQQEAERKRNTAEIPLRRRDEEGQGQEDDVHAADVATVANSLQTMQAFAVSSERLWRR